MPILPSSPYFSFNQKRHAIDFSDEVKVRDHVSRLTLVADSDSEWLAFDSGGAVWSFRYERPAGGFSFLARLLTHTVFNPVREVAVTWTEIRRYQFAELRQAFLVALEHDDDILTQFVEPDELRQRIEHSTSFHDLVEAWRWMETDTAFDETSA